jgi:hypothetical protein
MPPNIILVKNPVLLKSKEKTRLVKEPSQTNKKQLSLNHVRKIVLNNGRDGNEQTWNEIYEE